MREGKKPDIWNHQPKPIEGWTQMGDIHGRLYGVWFRQLTDGISASISLVGDQYWLRIGNVYCYASYKTPEAAARRAEKERERLLAEEHTQAARGIIPCKTMASEDQA